MSRRYRRIRGLQPVLKVEALGADGTGTARIGDRTVSIHGALPGERVQIRYIGASRRRDEAVVERVLEPAPQRVDAPCVFFNTCSGCSLQHLAMPAQLAYKERRLSDQFRAAGLEPESQRPPLSGPLWAYRRRGRLSVRYVYNKKRVLVGFREKTGRHVTDMDHCLVTVPAVGERVGALAGLLQKLEARDRIPQIEFAAGDGEAALVLRHLGDLEAPDRRLLADFGRETGLQLFSQTGGPDTVRPLWPDEPAPLSYALPEHGVTLQFWPLDFIQINGAVNRLLVDAVVALLGPAAGADLLDLFCGLGNFTLPLARRARHVTGIDGDARLIERARENAARNGAQNTSFQVTDLIAGEARPEWAGRRYAGVLMDPPRSGLGASARVVTGLDARRLVYVSCNGETLARDARTIVDSGAYRLASAGVVDMFPHTTHAEAIAVFDAR